MAVQFDSAANFAAKKDSSLSSARQLGDLLPKTKEWCFNRNGNMTEF